MAKHIAFGDPVNQAESWAFNLLKKELPDDYILLTNVEIPKHTGQAMEVDALVIGDWGIYVVDVKGYMGQLEAGQHAWTLDGREVENSLAKANYVARVLSGNLKSKIPVGVYAPWCQGMVFVTGRQGNTIELKKDSDQLSIYTPEKIVQALTKVWGLTSQRQFPVNPRQKQHVLDTIGQVAIVEKRNQCIQDFNKTKCLFIQGGYEIWQAEYQVSGWKSDWLLKILVKTEFEDEDSFKQQENRLNEQLQRIQNLAGCSGVPLCAPVIHDGEQVVLPIRMPRGVPISSFDYSAIDKTALIKILRLAATSLQQIHSKGYSVSNWQENQVFISKEGDVEFIEIANTHTPRDDIIGFAGRFSELAKSLEEPIVRIWFARAEQGHIATLDDLRSELSSLLSEPVAFEKNDKIDHDESTDLINHRYQLLEQIRKGDSSDIWKSWHVQGKFPCTLSIYRNIESQWLGLSDNYRRLKDIYHPNVERVIELGQVSGGDDIFFAREWVHGETLRELYDENIDAAQAAIWFDQLFNALSYLHSYDLYHGGISLKNIVLSGDKATLVNFGLGLDALGDSEYRSIIDPEIWMLEGGAKRDVFALVASFIIALSDGEFPLKVNFDMLRQRIDLIPSIFFTTERRKIFINALDFC